MNTKQELRKYYKTKRSLFSQHEVDQLSKKICTVLFNHFLLYHKTIHTFLKIEKLNEVNTDLILEQLFQNKNKVITSITQFEPLKLIHSQITPETKFELDQLNISIPKVLTPVDIKEIDIILIPLLAYDTEGNRIGYGKGLYDSFLSECRKDTLKIGVSFFEPLEHLINSEQHDIKLNFCVTPNKVFCF